MIFSPQRTDIILSILRKVGAIASAINNIMAASQQILKAWIVNISYFNFPQVSLCLDVISTGQRLENFPKNYKSTYRPGEKNVI